MNFLDDLIAKGTELVRNYEYAKQNGFQGSLVEFMRANKTDGGGSKFGLTPQYGVDENGEPALLQLSTDGTAQRTALPPGIRLSKEPIKLDAGTEWVLLDPVTRQPISRLPKNVAEEASAMAPAPGVRFIPVHRKKAFAHEASA